MQQTSAEIPAALCHGIPQGQVPFLAPVSKDVSFTQTFDLDDFIHNVSNHVGKRFLGFPKITDANPEETGSQHQGDDHSRHVKRFSST